MDILIRLTASALAFWMAITLISTDVENVGLGIDILVVLNFDLVATTGGNRYLQKVYLS